MFQRLFILLLLGFALCHPASAKPPPLNTAIVGTWRWASVNGRPVDKPFYLRYDADGTCSSWPVPKDWPNKNGVSYGKYSVADGKLILDTGSGKFDPKSKLVIQGDQMTLTTEDSDQMIYRWIVPTLDPGKDEPRKP